MNDLQAPSILLCRVGGQMLGVHLTMVERVERAMEIHPVPEAPVGLCGVVNVRGQVIPVLDPRPGLGIAPREIELTDQLVLLRVPIDEGSRPAALLVDETVGVVPFTRASSSAGTEPGQRTELVEGMHPGDDVIVVGEQLVIVRSDGVLVPPWVRDIAAADQGSLSATGDNSPAAGPSGMPAASDPGS